MNFKILRIIMVNIENKIYFFVFYESIYFVSIKVVFIIKCLKFNVFDVNRTSKKVKKSISNFDRFTKVSIAFNGLNHS